MMRFITRASVLVIIVSLANVGVDSAAPAVPVDVTARRPIRHVTIPAGTILRLRVNRSFGSDISRVEDSIPATLARPVIIGGRTVLPAGSPASGYVAQAVRPGKVKGRGRVAVRFTRITPAGDDTRYNMQTRPWVAVAPATKMKDAMTIGLPAAGGATLGGLIKGKTGAGVGAAIGGGTGTAVVLSTRGKDVHVGRGATLAVRLTAPLRIATGD